MRKLLFDPHVKLAFISGVYTLFLLLTLPRIPVKIDYKGLKVDSYVGGYKFRLFGKDFDFSTFKKSAEFGGGYRFKFKVLANDEVKVREVISNRLSRLGITDYNISSRVEGTEASLDLTLPFVENERSVESFLKQRSFLVFRELIPEVVWKEEDAEKYFYAPSYWVDAGLDSTQILGITLLKNTNAENPSVQFQINLTPEGKKIFGEVVKRNVGEPLALYIDDASLPIAMPLIGEDFAALSDINPVVTSNIDPSNTKLFADHVNSGYYPAGYEYMGKEEVQAVYSGFSTRLFALSSALGFMAASLFVYLTYRKLSSAFLLSLSAQFITMLFLLKVFSIYIGLRTVLIVSLSMSLYLAFGVLLLSQMKEHARDMSLLGIYMKEAFRNSVAVIKPYLLVAAFGAFLFNIVTGWESLALLRDLMLGYVSSYIAFVLFRLFAGLFWPRKSKSK
ncbi:MAG: hypothetical protein WC243_02790 [Patescibacteria group bacterium]|jgi:hypothetical protein